MAYHCEAEKTISITLTFQKRKDIFTIQVVVIKELTRHQKSHILRRACCAKICSCLMKENYEIQTEDWNLKLTLKKGHVLLSKKTITHCLGTPYSHATMQMHHMRL